MKAIITHGPVADEEIEITVDDLEEKWVTFNDLRTRRDFPRDAPFDVIKRITEERKTNIQIAPLELKMVYQKESAVTYLLLIG